MAPTRKEQYEKNAWSWVENCNPQEVTDEHIETVYRVNLSRCKIGVCRRNCRGNPFCLSNLGEQKWLGNHEDFGSDQINDPEKERRKPGSYVGLKNLGATCYVNSLLQLWFHNLNFRKAIFMWDPLQDPEEKQNITIPEGKYIPFSILGHLQAVFALMQYGERRYIDPTDFISSLRLDTSIQQDAQEFSKLFLSKLETVLSYQSVKEVRDLIKDNFCGEYSYVTRCMKCKNESKRPSTFYELDLNIKGHKTIQDCLKEFMNIEMLEGDDKYFCQLCNEKQDAQRFISLTELPPILNLQLMRFVFDKHTGYKKKLNTFVQFPDKLNMTEFCPNVKGNLEYTLSAVLVHGGRSANSGHYVAHICDSESGTWYKFNDESVEKIEGKKLKLGNEDEYEDGGKKVKIPRAPKGSYHSLNAYMLVYTRNDIIPAPSSAEKPKSEECNLAPHLKNFVIEQNLLFENWVIDVTKCNDLTFGRSVGQQIEMASDITMLPVELECDNFEAIPTSWLSNWLSDPDNDCIIDNEKYSCNHGKLDPSEVGNVKYINWEMAEKLFDKYGGECRFKYGEFECRSCVINKCFKIRVKNKMQHEFKLINNKLKAKLNESEPGYWVGKQSLRSWRRLASENLENGLLDYNSMGLLNDANTTNKTPSYKYEDFESAEKEESNRTEFSHGDYNKKNENVNKCSGDYRAVNGGDFCEEMEVDSAEKDSIAATLASCEKIKLNIKLPPHIISKLEECYSLSAHSNIDNIPLMNKLLKEVIEFINNLDVSPYKFVSSGDMKCSLQKVKTEPEEENKASISSYNGAFYNFLQNRDKTLKVGDHCVEEYATRIVDESTAKNEDQTGREIVSSNIEKSIQIRHSNCEANPTVCNNINTAVDAANENKILVNGDAVPYKPKSIDNEDESSNSETRFNEDLLCQHGNLCLEENNRKLVPEEVWRMLRKYFPHANEFTSQSQPCGLCKSLASEYEVAKDMYKNDAMNQKEQLLDLYLDRNRPQLKFRPNENENVYYAVNKEFINSWRKFIRENGKKEPPYSIKNKSSLLCHDHSSLLYDLKQDIPNTIVLLTRKEWEHLSVAYNADCEINVKCIEDGTIVSTPDVCLPCMQHRIENEEKAQLCYAKAKIYIKIQNEEEVDSLSNEESRPPAKRAKIAPSNSINNNVTSTSGTLNGGSHSSSVVTSTYGTGVCLNSGGIASDATTANNVDGNVSSTSEIGDTSNEICQNGTVGNVTSTCNGNGINGKSQNANSTTVPNGGSVNGNGLSVDPVAVRRSSRCRRGVRGIKEIVVSSDLTLLDVKKKICEMMNVAPMDQHLSTADGRSLMENAATLAELSIYPDTVLNLKVDEPCDGVIADDFIASREPEAGFKGTGLVGS